MRAYKVALYHITLLGSSLGLLYSDENPLMGSMIADSSLQDKKHADVSRMQNDHQSFDNAVFIEADFIYWNVGQEGNNYAAYGITRDNNVSVVSPGSIYRPSPKMAPGFKVALGVNLDKDMWDVTARYTWIKAHSRGNTPSQGFVLPPNNSGIIRLFSTSGASIASKGSSLGTSNHYATVDSKIQFNAVDTELGRNFYLSDSFYLRGYTGLKTVWLKESLSVDYVAQTLTNPYAGETITEYVQHYWGLGPRVGGTGVWKLYKNYIELFVDGAFSALWSWVDLDARVKDSLYVDIYTQETSITPVVLVQSATSAVILHQRYRMHTLLPVFELTLGLQTEWIFDNGGRLLVSAGWETQMFLFMVQHSSTIADTSLNMEGLTLKFRYDF